MTPSLTPTLQDLISNPANAALLASPTPSVSLAPQPAGIPILRNLIGDQTPMQAPGPMDTSGLGGNILPSLPDGGLRPLVTNPRNDYMNRLQSRIDSYNMPDPAQPGFWHALGRVGSKIGNIIGNDFLPHTMAMIPGTDLYKQVQEVNAEQKLNTMRAEDQTLLNNNSKRALEGAQTAHTQEETSEMPGEAQDKHDYITAQTDALDGPKYEVHDTANGPIFINTKNGTAQYISANGLPVGPKIQTKVVPLQIGGKPHQVLVNDATGELIKDMGESGEKAPVTNVNAGTWSVQTDTSGNPILLNSKTGETKAAPPNLARKPSVAEQNRADFAENMNSNLNALEDIVNRRPDLFGPIRGRLSEAMQKVGTDDKDLATLQALEEQMGMVQQSTHGMKSSLGVQAAAKSILNNMHNGPSAMRGSIKAVRDSIQTFTNDADRGNTEQGPQTGSGGPQQGGQTSAPSFRVHMADARKAAPRQGMSDDDIRKDVASHGGEVIP